MKYLFKIAFVVSLLMCGAATAQTQGVSDDEVLIGSNSDLSGPFAGFGAPSVRAANLFFDEINAAGGVHGRKIRLIVEDHGYQLPRAMTGFNKLLNSDRVFAMFLTTGTPMNVALFPLLEGRGVPNVAPLSVGRQLLDPPAPYKYASVSSYYDQIRAGVRYLVENEGATNICAMYIPSDFGQEIAEGAKDISLELGLNFASETTHRPDEQDFVGSLTKLRADGCDTIAIALGLRQVITAVATAKKIGWTDVNFMGSSASFHTAVARVPGGVTEGMYASAGWSDIVARMDNPTLAEWVASYQEATGEAPPTGALLGRAAAELLVRALDAAGPDLTHESFQTAMESLEYTDEILGVDIDYGPGDHQGADVIIISRIVEGNWIEVARQ